MKPFEEMSDLELFLELTRCAVDDRMQRVALWARENRPEMVKQANLTMWGLTNIQDLGRL